MTLLLEPGPRLTLAEWAAIVNDPTDRTYRHLTGIVPDAYQQELEPA